MAASQPESQAGVMIAGAAGGGEERMPVCPGPAAAVKWLEPSEAERGASCPVVVSVPHGGWLKVRRAPAAAVIGAPSSL